MRLPYPDLLLDAWLKEFDIWITPKLSEIKDTERFKSELSRISIAIDALEKILGSKTPTELQSSPYSEIISSKYIEFVLKNTSTTGAENNALFLLDALAATLFMVTGKSDNNFKCQFPLHLKNQLDWQSIPKKRRNRGRTVFTDSEIPRVIKSETFNATIAALLVHETNEKQTKIAKLLLSQFISFVLSDPEHKQQLQSIVYSYHHLKEDGQNPDALLAPLVSFQVRGSVSASGGHEPEEILREKMEEWGLLRDIDFNITDVVLDFEAGKILEENEISEANQESDKKAKIDKKTRAFDFVLPFRTPGWTPRIFIQSQFYAGDSGSVSHKNVDQTSTSRNNATRLLETQWSGSPRPRFIEYVDGAGYAASLFGDLKKLLQMEDTKSFFQIKSSPIRLRREIQDIGFLTLLEIEHAILSIKDQSEKSVKEYLMEDGYLEQEVERNIERHINKKILKLRDDNSLDIIDSDRHLISRRYLLLDIIANSSSEFSSSSINGAILIPGFGPYYGLELSSLGEAIDEEHEGVWVSFSDVTEDLDWLCKQGYIKLK
ncbi:hypothetical protein GPM19_10370 [Halomonas sp. ZH2S]|uniref:Uncharacterized protein n=1 Tax=Vreelandella zhuhanensis TaxID=2684210 RepID=A0A7X3KQL1_9GAMM|nr:hypothetical protein [Halomonas zhuhanensis]MWJ28605.1 hypothetical protein [Halomonas zhuhanensis]